MTPRTWIRLYRESFAGLPRATWLLALVTVINRAGTMVVPFLALYFTKSLGYRASEAGLLLGIWGAGGILGAFLGGALSDRLGSVRVQVVTLVACGVGFFVLGQCRVIWTLAITLFAIGVVFSAFRPANGSTLAATCPAEKRGQAFALQRLAINFGMGIGPVTGGFLASVDYSLLFLVDGTVCILSGALLGLLLRGTAAVDSAEEQAADVGRSPWRDGAFLGLMLVTLATAFIMFQWMTTGPLYLRDAYGMDEKQIGLMLALNPLLIVLFEMILVHSLRGRPPVPWIATGAALSALSCALFPLGTSLGWAALVVSVWTMGEMLESPLTGAFVANRAGPKHRGRYMGVLNIAYSTALVLSPIAGTTAYEKLGPEVLWFGTAVIGGMAAIGAFALARRLSRRPVE